MVNSAYGNLIVALSRAKGVWGFSAMFAVFQFNLAIALQNVNFLHLNQSNIYV